MNATQKKFILKKLIPFILREQGRGFIMEDWALTDLEPGKIIQMDGVTRKAPACGTVCCIGGSTEFLKHRCSLGTQNEVLIASDLGLTLDQTHGLCYNWEGLSTHAGEDGNRYAWPMKFKMEFAARTTTLGKARVAVRLLQEVVRTNGECLNQGPY